MKTTKAPLLPSLYVYIIFRDFEKAKQTNSKEKQKKYEHIPA